MKAIREVCLDGEKNDRMAFQARADLQNLVIAWLRKECRSLGGGTVVRFPWFWMSSGECRSNTLVLDRLVHSSVKYAERILSAKRACFLMPLAANKLINFSISTPWPESKDVEILSFTRRRIRA